MRQIIEQTDNEIRGLESQVEQVQNTVEEIGQQLMRIAETMTLLESRGDHETSNALLANLKEKQEREQDARREVSRLSAELDDIQGQLVEAQTQNSQSQKEIEALTRIGEDVGSAIEEVSGRNVILRYQEQQIRALRERLGGFAAADTALYEPRSIPPISERVKWIDEGIQPVSVREIPPPEGIGSAADFQKISEGEMKAGILKLQEMQRAIEDGAGASSDYWRAFDKERGLEHAGGYQRVYDAFFGIDAIKVTYDGEKYDIINGRHRIWLAQKMGIDYLPMRVTRKFEIQNT